MWHTLPAPQLIYDDSRISGFDFMLSSLAFCCGKHAHSRCSLRRRGLLTHLMLLAGYPFPTGRRFAAAAPRPRVLLVQEPYRVHWHVARARRYGAPGGGAAVPAVRRPQEAHLYVHQLHWNNQGAPLYHWTFTYFVVAAKVAAEMMSGEKAVFVNLAEFWSS